MEDGRMMEGGWRDGGWGRKERANRGGYPLK